MDTTKTITHLSLCSGYSGIGLGLKRVLPNLREIAHVEIEAYAIANLVAKMEESKLPPAPIFTNLKTFPFASFRGCVDIISGGFPCQPFSTAGKRKASEDPRHLFPFIKDGIAACRPRLVFLENVEGIISAKMPDGTSVLQYVLQELESVGYRATAGVFSAAEVGASHQRKRVFILGVADTESGALWERQQRTETEHTTSGNHSETMADTEHTRPHGTAQPGGTAAPIRDDEERANGAQQPERIGIPSELADTERERREGEFNKARGEEGNPDLANHKSFLPIARPGEQQFAHEEPRTKSKLGRAINGASNRVDRLRACGNGVVPATAEKAFITLINRLT
mgnify:CR=1 FL=1